MYLLIYNKFKEKANKFFAQGIYEEAIDNYTTAITFNPNVPAYFSNRSLGFQGVNVANFKLELYGSALQDADSALQIDPSFVKGYYRRASANMAIGKLKGK